MKRIVLSVISFYVLLVFPKIVKASDDVQYLVITHNNFTSGVSPLVNWYHKRGIGTRIINKSNWTANEIKDSILVEYNKHSPPALKWVLLVGDVNYVPAYMGYWYIYMGDTIYYSSDAWYSFLEGEDYYADVGIGRLSVQNTTELNNQINKILKYERDPPLDNWLNKSLLVAHYDPPCRRCTRIICNYDYTYFSPIFDTLMGYIHINSGGPTNEDVAQAINEGRNIVNYRGHGKYDRWEQWNNRRPFPGEDWTISDVNALSNGNMTPIVFSICCYNNEIDLASIGEAWMNKYPGGAVAHLAASHRVFGISNDAYNKALFWAFCGSDNIAHGLQPPIFDLGWISNYAAAYIISKEIQGEDDPPNSFIDNTKKYLWLGDPAMEIWTGVTEVLDVTYPTEVDEYSQFDVVVKYGDDPIQNALVCIWKGDEIYITDSTDANGTASFWIPNIDHRGYMDVTVTAHGYFPHEGSTYVHNLDPVLFGALTYNGEVLAALSWQWSSAQCTLKYYILKRLNVWDKNMGTATHYTDPDPFKRGESRTYAVHVYFYKGGPPLCKKSNLVKLTRPRGGPLAYIWNGGEFIEDNNILPPTDNPDSNLNVTDYYKLEQPLYKKENAYSLKIKEFEEEHSFIDKIKLVSIDHHKGIGVGFTPNGDMLKYTKGVAPVSCIDNNGHDCLSLIKKIDDKYFTGESGDYLIVEYPRVSGDSGHVLLPMERPIGKLGLTFQIEKEGIWEDVVTLKPRENWSTQVINLTPYMNMKHFRIKICWNGHYGLNYIGLANIVSAMTIVQECTPGSATHSVMGDITNKLLEVDEDYAELTPGEEINLVFAYPEEINGLTRDFVLISDGYYTAYEGKPAYGGSQTGGESHACLTTAFSVVPNPFTTSVKIKYILPKTTNVKIDIYNCNGMLVKTIFCGTEKSGQHSIEWDGKNNFGNDVSSGVYFVKSTINKSNYTRKIILLR